MISLWRTKQFGYLHVLPVSFWILIVVGLVSTCSALGTMEHLSP